MCGDPGNAGKGNLLGALLGLRGGTQQRREMGHHEGVGPRRCRNVLECSTRLFEDRPERPNVGVEFTPGLVQLGRQSMKRTHYRKHRNAHAPILYASGVTLARGGVP